MPVSWPKLGAESPPASRGLTARPVVHNLLAMQPIGYGNLTPARLDATFAALADPTRRAILARLATGEASVRELAEPFTMSQAAISKHLKVLERAGLISHGRDAQRRPRKLEAAPLMRDQDRKSTRLNSSHVEISYAVFCLKKKK